MPIGTLGPVATPRNVPGVVQLLSNPASGGRDRTADFAAAIAACPVGGVLEMTPGDLPVSGAVGPLIDVNKYIHLLPHADGGPTISVAAGVGAGVDIMRIQAAANEKMRQVAGFTIDPGAATPGRYGLVLDLTNGHMGVLSLRDVRIGNDNNGFGDYALKLVNPGAKGFYSSQLRGLWLNGGADLTDNCGDSVWMENGTVTGPRDVRWSCVGGAISCRFAKMNVTAKGGLVLVNVSDFDVDGCEFEQTAATSNANSAIISVLGTRNVYNASHVRVHRCNLHQSGNQGITYPVYVDASEHFDLAASTIRKGNTGHVYIDTFAVAPSFLGRGNEWQTGAGVRMPELAATVSQNGVADNENVISCLARIEGFNPKAVAQTDLYTAGTNEALKISHVAIRQTGAFANGGAPAQLHVGVHYSYQAWDTSKLIGTAGAPRTIPFTAQRQAIDLYPVPGDVAATVGGTQLVTLGIDVASTHTTEVWTVELWGSRVTAPI